jgi:hypothetical protein
MSRPELEVADIVRQHGDAYLERYGATKRAVTTAGTKSSRITRVDTAVAPNATAPPKPSGSRHGGVKSFRQHTSM